MLFSEIDFLLTFDFKGNTNLIILQDELLTILTTEIVMEPKPIGFQGLVTSA